MRTFALTLCWLLALPSLLLALLIILPAPLYQLWQASVGVSEWCVFLSLVALVALVLGLVALSLRPSRGAALGAAVATLALGISSLPTFQAYQVASRVGVQLSWQRYFLGTSYGWDERLAIPFANAGGQELKLDVYRPRDVGADARLPGVLVIHGGGWGGGARSDFPRHDAALASEGYVVFDVDYRLVTPSSRFPDQIADVKCAISWAKQHAAEYNFDPSRLALIGRSAGGQLALLAAYTPNDPALPPSCAAGDTAVQAVVGLYAPTDLAWGYDNPSTPDVLDGPQLLRNYLGGPPATASAAYAQAAPTEHVTASAPPTLLLHGGQDRLVGSQNAVRLLAKLQAAGVSAEYVYLPWGQHGFDYNFNGWGNQIAEATIRRFLAAHLQP